MRFCNGAATVTSFPWEPAIPINIASSAAGGDVCAEPFPPFLFVCVFWRREKMSARTHPVSRQRSPDDQENSGISGAGAWLDAHYDPVASLYTFSSCMALEDLNRDGDHKGPSLSFETPLLDLPHGGQRLLHGQPLTPELQPLPWQQARCLRLQELRPYFNLPYPTFREGNKEVPLSVRSLKYLQLEDDAELQASFLATFRHIPLRRKSVITAMAILKKSHTEDDAVSCLVVASENGDIYVLDPEAFTVLKQFLLPSPAVFLSVTGLHDVDYHISAACRDNCIYTFKSGASTTPRYKIPLASQPCGLQRINKDVVVGCMDDSLASYSVKGRRQWSLRLPASLTCMELLHHRPRSFKAVVVALQNREVRIYKDKFLVNCITVDDVVVGLKFGPFGREDGVLLMVTQGGALLVKILKRSVSFEAKDLTPGPPAAQLDKLNIPKRTRVYVEQMAREKANASTMHSVFQQDLSRLRLQITQAYAKAVTSRLTPLTASPDCSLKIAAQVQGLGPIFRLTVTVQNTSPSKPVTNCYITFRCDEGLYRITRKFIQMPLLVPTVSYNFDTMVQCTDDMGRAEEISVYVVQNHTSTPLITAVLNMPVSETIIVT
ncbi:Bardet-Biedl syndrome 1 protein homolog [Geodia barretti]|uniref:Bardet-Biedl syndrome 1 protein homolog n=1 Tax=Geodia barretti TaxID=519541 RepID=A0AA35QWD1_GEOBA|nr:Bardet-Biedl syndrome 1 protein homolog [Geodia barretti]